MFDKVAGSDDEIDIFEFYEWIMGSFGSLNDEQFAQGMGGLISAAEKAINPSPPEEIGASPAEGSNPLQDAVEMIEIQAARIKQLEQTVAELTAECSSKTSSLKHTQQSEGANARLIVERDKCNANMAFLMRERSLVLEVVAGAEQPEGCSIEPFLELDDELWAPLIRLVTLVPELQSRNDQFKQEMGLLQLLMHDMQRKPGNDQRDSESIVDAGTQLLLDAIIAAADEAAPEALVPGGCDKSAAAAADEAAPEALVSGSCDKSAAAADEAALEALVPGACDKSAAAADEAALEALISGACDKSAAAADEAALEAL